MSLFVKICGITSTETARVAAEAGADAIGLVFADSPRRVDTRRAADIAAAVPAHVWKVGLFVNADADAMNAVVDEVGLTHVQLHGDESPELLPLLYTPALKAFGLRDEASITAMHEWLVCIDGGELEAVLLDAFCPDARGGTGKRIDADLLRAARANGWLEGAGNIMLAGGLTPENVAEAVALVQPWGVDVSSGVESSPGVKDPEAIRRFIAAARE
ncbi:MAG: N-(5'-phosphoribosyl)anthranilate isomerase [Planctomycetes bacterium]|jgi:phosphoribosylanthranilate isomerase|nr:N-(5'-phosphoribosyl)anthranilate isomerase [Planctomycetota bacterium]